MILPQTIQPLQSAEHRTPGISLIPDSWSCLTALERFELRGHKELASLPSWMPTTLTRLTHLDVSDGFQHDDGFDLTLVPSFRGLRCLVLQGMGLTESAGLTLPVLPDLSPLAGSLTALSLARNELYKVPNCFTTLSNLQWLDLSRNRLMPLSSYRSLNVAFWPQLRVLNLQARPHEQTESEVISVAAELSQQLSRRPYPTKVVVGVAAPTTDDAPLTAAVAGQGLGVQQL